MNRPDDELHPEDAADYDVWVHDTRHIREWVNGGGVPTDRLRDQLREALTWIDAPYSTELHKKVATDD